MLACWACLWPADNRGASSSGLSQLPKGLSCRVCKARSALPDLSHSVETAVHASTPKIETFDQSSVDLPLGVDTAVHNTTPQIEAWRDGAGNAVEIFHGWMPIDSGQDFFDCFLADSVKFSVLDADRLTQLIQEQIMEKWDVTRRSRTWQYEAPSNVPPALGASKVRVNQLHRYRFMSAEGVEVPNGNGSESLEFVQEITTAGVKYADTFYLRQLWTVKPRGSARGAGCDLRITVEAMFYGRAPWAAQMIRVQAAAKARATVDRWFNTVSASLDMNSKIRSATFDQPTGWESCSAPCTAKESRSRLASDSVKNLKVADCQPSSCNPTDHKSVCATSWCMTTVCLVIGVQVALCLLIVLRAINLPVLVQEAQKALPPTGIREMSGFLKEGCYLMSATAFAIYPACLLFWTIFEGRSSTLPPTTSEQGGICAETRFGAGC